MEVIQTSAFWIGLFKIIWVNILLSGDNAVVIALAARSLPPVQQRLAVIWGSVAAIIMRVVLTIFAVQLLELPWLKLIGAVLLLWIGVQLLCDSDGEGHVKESSTIMSAIKTILIADLVMSLDNVLGVAAAADAAPAEAKTILLIIGLALSIPIVIFGSGVVLKLMERFPIIVTLGAMLLGWIAGEMAVKESILAGAVHAIPFAHYAAPAAGALLVLAIGRIVQSRSKPVGVDDV
ncbi:TerC family protein [Uliginosibacterium sp. 31-16]|uniref:TerC family protein n=1 Tax=Uliginosibacterium sp. 31-16 TaxID=3068315 RepID=UPI00273DF739|nr:TerC family protein [Uliginosibacterium sp. 31-16]MDP5240660.1 TerC family protein [Uliginosibacterium sp. 31-16]